MYYVQRVYSVLLLRMYYYYVYVQCIILCVTDSVLYNMVLQNILLQNIMRTILS